MPIIRSAKKRVRQSEVRRVHNHARLSRMRSLYKNLIKWFTGGEIEKADRFLSTTQKEIDLCAKSHLLHPNTASRKKSYLARLRNGALEKKNIATSSAETKK